MGFHTFDPAEAERLEDPTRFRFCSREELLQWLPADAQTVLDVGSGTGFYTDELAPFFDRIVALDLQPEMHRQYQERGLPDSVFPVTADAASLPFADESFEGIVSTMTFHESASDSATAELFRVLSQHGRLVIVDWSRAGRGENGPPRTERYDAETVRGFLSSIGFSVKSATERSETFLIVAGKE